MAATADTQRAGGHLAIVAIPGEGALALCDLDGETGTLALVHKQRLPGVEGGCSGVPMAASADGRRLYVAWRGAVPRLFSFAVDPDARRLGCVGAASLPASMCHAMVSSCGRRLLTASYTGSTVAISPIDREGRAGDPVMTQEVPHAHCLVEAPNGLVYATSLRGDFIQAYAFGADRNDLSAVARFEMPAGSGPRHLVFSADGMTAHVLSEFAGTLTRLDIDPDTGALTPRASVALLPPSQKAWAAELRFGPDETVLYATERNTSQIFGYRLAADGGMRLICTQRAPDCPRAFTAAPSGRHLIVLGEKSGDAWSYLVGPDGRLDLVARSTVGAAPSWIVVGSR